MVARYAPGTVRKSIRSMFGDIEKDYPHLKETLLSAMGNIEPQRLRDTRYLNLEGDAASEEPEPELLPILENGEGLSLSAPLPRRSDLTLE